MSSKKKVSFESVPIKPLGIFGTEDEPVHIEQLLLELQMSLSVRCHPS